MRQVIAGKIYNTETASIVCEVSCMGYYYGDFNYHDTSVYRTKRGAFFLAGEGGPLSMWAKASGNNGHVGGSGIRVLSEHEARGYMERADCDPDEFAAAGFVINEA